MPFDFDSDSFLKLVRVDHEALDWLNPMLADEEKPLISLKSVRDGVCFTSFRIILRNEQGITGSKMTLSSVPYHSITSYSIETAGLIGMSFTIKIYVKEAGEFKLNLIRDSDIKIFDGLLSRAIIKGSK